MELRPGLELDEQELAGLCRRHGITRLAAFGSVLRADFGPHSDIDLLVEFAPGHVPGLLQVAQLELEIGALLDGRDVEARTPEDLSPLFRDEVRARARPLYAAA